MSIGEKHRRIKNEDRDELTTLIERIEANRDKINNFPDLLSKHKKDYVNDTVKFLKKVSTIESFDEIFKEKSAKLIEIGQDIENRISGLKTEIMDIKLEPTTNFISNYDSRRKKYDYWESFGKRTAEYVKIDDELLDQDVKDFIEAVIPIIDQAKKRYDIETRKDRNKIEMHEETPFEITTEPRSTTDIVPANDTLLKKIINFLASTKLGSWIVRKLNIRPKEEVIIDGYAVEVNQEPVSEAQLFRQMMSDSKGNNSISMGELTVSDNNVELIHEQLKGIVQNSDEIDSFIEYMKRIGNEKFKCYYGQTSGKKYMAFVKDPIFHTIEEAVIFIDNKRLEQRFNGQDFLFEQEQFDKGDFVKLTKIECEGNKDIPTVSYQEGSKDSKKGKIEKPDLEFSYFTYTNDGIFNDKGNIELDIEILNRNYEFLYKSKSKLLENELPNNISSGKGEDYQLYAKRGDSDQYSACNVVRTKKGGITDYKYLFDLTKKHDYAEVVNAIGMQILEGAESILDICPDSFADAVRHGFKVIPPEVRAIYSKISPKFLKEIENFERRQQLVLTMRTGDTSQGDDENSL